MALQILWRPGVDNYTPGRPYGPPIALVDHIMGGSLVATDSWFKNTGSQASTNFGVGRTGLVYQWVRLTDSAWGNGIPEAPDMSVPWLATAMQKGWWLNGLTVSIEHEGTVPGDPFPEAQYQASLELHKFLLTALHIPVSRNSIIGHFQIQRYARANCPGPNFPWSRLMADLTAWAAATANEETVNGHIIRGEIRSYWRSKGDIAVFGLPLSEEMLWPKTPVAGQKQMTVQVFERQVLQFNPAETQAAYRVQGMLIGAEWARSKGML